MSLVRCFLASALALPAFFDVSTAFACGPLPCAQLNDIQPADGSTGVALNTELRVLYFGSLEPYSEDGSCQAGVENIRLMPSSGEPIQLQGSLHERPSAAESWIVAKLDPPLAANTGYALQLQLGPGRDACRCDEREWVTVSSFTSGVEADREPPAFAGITALTYAARAQGSSTCGETDGFPALPALTTATDVFPEPRYNVYVNGELARRYVKALSANAGFSELFVDCGSTALSTWTLVQPGDGVEVRAVDLSGNESTPNEPIVVDVSCESPDSPESTASTTSDNAPPTDVTSDAGSDVVVIGRGLADDPRSSLSSPGCALPRRFGAERSAAFGALFMLFAWWRRRTERGHET